MIFLTLQSIVTQTEKKRDNPRNIDELYSELCDVIFDEINNEFHVKVQAQIQLPENALK